MSNRILVLSGHLGEGRFGQALADAYGEGAEQAGGSLRRFDLADLNFEASLVSGDYDRSQSLEEDITTLQAALRWCDHWTIVHPLWWGGMPGPLKSLIDRVLLPGFAFQYRPGKALPEKLLKGRSARVMITSDTPSWYLNLFYGAGHQKATKRQVLNFVGFKPVQFDLFGPMRTASEDKRAAWLAKAGAMGGRDAKRGVVAKAA